MITQVAIKNYYSFFNLSICLSPFTLLIGANGTGKSNFLRVLKNRSGPRHYNYHQVPQEIKIVNDLGTIYSINNGQSNNIQLPELTNVCIFSIDPGRIGQGEHLVATPTVSETGAGAVQVLDSLKTGDREDLFYQIENTFKEHVPEIEKLSFVPNQDVKMLRVREKHIKQPVLVSQLSEGIRLALTILTIIFQERRPTLICIEEIDRGLHPRLFEKIIQLCFEMTSRPGMPQIIATTHNPYLVDQFKDHESAVVIVEKEEGNSQFTILAERLKNIEGVEEPLGSLWYSGFVGGVPVHSRR